MATIVQNYGPIYGEVVNGTVQGRPNGSVYVPVSNTINLVPNAAATHIKVTGGNLVICNSGAAGKSVGVVAQSQDLASYVKTIVYSDAACTTQVGTARMYAAGAFNFNTPYACSYYSGTLTSGDPYYLRAVLVNNNSDVAASSTIELEAI